MLGRFPLDAPVNGCVFSQANLLRASNASLWPILWSRSLFNVEDAGLGSTPTYLTLSSLSGGLKTGYLYRIGLSPLTMFMVIV